MGVRMNYYEHHLGDYAKDTGHLSMLENGAYRILLDRYYSTEAGIPEPQAYRLAKARTEDERQAVDAVLDEFFELVDGVWIQCALSRIERARQNGKRGGRPPKPLVGSEIETQTKPSGFPVGSETETQTQPNAKLTNHQSPSTSKPSDRESNTSEPEVGREAGGKALAHPTDAGAACLQMRQAGVLGVNPSHPRLLALLAAGVTPQEIGELAREPVARGKGMVWVLAAVEGRRRDAAAVATLPRGRPRRPSPDDFEAKNYGNGGLI
jgi:uncharacterized protein YdaU (DUF1376 family)